MHHSKSVNNDAKDLWNKTFRMNFHLNLFSTRHQNNMKSQSTNLTKKNLRSNKCFTKTTWKAKIQFLQKKFQTFVVFSLLFGLITALSLLNT